MDNYWLNLIAAVPKLNTESFLSSAELAAGLKSGKINVGECSFEKVNEADGSWVWKVRYHFKDLAADL